MDPISPLPEWFQPDAPLTHLLSLRENPLIATATAEQLTAIVKELRQHANTPQTLSARLRKDSAAIKTPRSSSAAAKKQQLLADL